MAKAIRAHRMGGQLVVTGRPVTWRGPLLLLACVAVALLACQTVATRPDEPVATRPDEPLDPQALVGEWRGVYVNHFNPNFSDVLVVTITRVEGDRVFGTLDQWIPSRGHATRRRTRPVQGTLHGHTLKTYSFEATVNGRRMTGHFKDEEFELIKQTAGVPQQMNEGPARGPTGK